MQCGFKASAPTENELMPKIAEHAAKAHNIKTIDPALLAKVKAAIKK
jgi:predicted small metal-binding protein